MPTGLRSRPIFSCSHPRSSGYYISNATQTAQTAPLLTAATARRQSRAGRARAMTASSSPRQPMPRLSSSANKRVRPLLEKVITTFGAGSLTKNLAYTKPSRINSHATMASAVATDTILEVALVNGCAPANAVPQQLSETRILAEREADALAYDPVRRRCAMAAVFKILIRGRKVSHDGDEQRPGRSGHVAIDAVEFVLRIQQSGNRHVRLV